jgi:6-phosphogluconolactonase
MTSEGNRGRIIEAGSAHGVARVASERIAQALRIALARDGFGTLALSGGETPRETYALLARQPDVDWARVQVFFVDERAVAPTEDRSNYRWAKQTLLDAARIPSDHVHRMRAEDSSGEAAAQDYERLIRKYVAFDADGLPAFDAAVMGIGDDGHTASLFPGETTVSVLDRLVAAVPAGAGHEPRMTITVPVIQHARRLFFIVEGAAKGPALERVFAEEGDVRRTPARVALGCRGSVEWIVDDVLAKVVKAPTAQGISPKAKP